MVGIKYTSGLSQLGPYLGKGRLRIAPRAFPVKHWHAVGRKTENSHTVAVSREGGCSHMSTANGWAPAALEPQPRVCPLCRKRAPWRAALGPRQGAGESVLRLTLESQGLMREEGGATSQPLVALQ